MYFMFLVSRNILVIKLSLQKYFLIWMMKVNLHLFQKRFWRQSERRLRSITIKEYLVQWKDLPSEDATWEEEKILQHPNLKLLEDNQSWVGRTVMSPFKYLHSRIIPSESTSSLGWMETFGILIRELINDVQILECYKYLIMELIK